MMKIWFKGLLMLMMFSCAEGSNTEVTPTPMNLSINITLADNSTGLIGLQVNAENTNYFVIDFGDGSASIESSEKSYTHQYQESGTYTVTVKAHSSEEEYIEDAEQITIDLPDLEIPSSGYTTPTSYAAYNLIWSDEFNGTSLSNDWTYEIGTGSNGWGNNELQYYTDKNTVLKDGFLVIEARKESVGGQAYTSSRIVTEGNQSFQYGRIDIRAVLPEGQGIWPALWMLGSNFRQVGWPKCGEIDIMEMIGGQGRENDVFGTLHWDNNGQYACTCGQGHYTLSNGTFNDEFHVFSLVWTSSQIQWFVDDNLFNTIDITPADLEEFRNDFFFIFNIAVGGNLPGSPDNTTVFPQQMVVDYVRVFQEK